MKLPGVSSTRGLVAAGQPQLVRCSSLLGEAREILGGVSDHFAQMGLNFIIQLSVSDREGVEVFLCETLDNACHKVEVRCASIDGKSNELVDVVLVVKVLGARNAKTSHHVGHRGVVPEADIKLDNLGTKVFPLIGGIRRGEGETLRAAIVTAPQRRDKLAGPFARLLAARYDVLGKPVKLPTAQSLQGLGLGLDTRKRILNASFGSLRLRIEVDGLSDGYYRKDSSYDGRNLEGIPGGLNSSTNADVEARRK